MATTAFLEKAYLAYFGRPVDLSGLAAYGPTTTATEAHVLADFSSSPESVALYGPVFDAAQVNAIYNMLFGRDAEPAGLAYWLTVVNRGDYTPAGAAYAILQGAQNADAIAVANKLTASAAFSAEVDTTDEILGYVGDDAAAAARAFLQTVTSTVPTPTEVTAAVAGVVAVGGIIGETLALTTGVDNLKIETLNTINTINGVVDGDWDGDTSGSTFSIADIIDGNGKTILKLAIAEGGDAAFATVKDIATIDLLAGDNVGVYFNAVDWSNIGKIQLNAGVNGASAYFSNLHAGVDLSVGSAISASLTVDYTDGHSAWVYSDKGASIDYIDGGDITGAAAAGKDVSASVWASADAVSLTVGDVNLVGAAAGTAYFGAYQNQDVAGDITVGNVSMTGFNQIYLTVENTGHTAASPASNVTIGDIALSVGDSGWISASVSNSGDGVVGNTTIGNISLTAGDNVTSAYFYQYQWGGMGAGDVTVGDVSVVAGVSADDADVYIENYAGWNGGAATAAITQGAMTVGNISYDLAMNATGYLSISAEAYTSAAGIDLTVGAYTIGDLSVNLAQAATLTMWFNQSAYAWGGGAATVGDVSIGNGNFDLAVDASLSYTVNVEAYSNGGPAASIGNVAIGNVDLNMGINTSASVEYSVYAYGTDPAMVSVGDVTIGDMNAVIDDGASLEYSVSVTSYGSLGNVDLGSLTIAAGVSATAYVSSSIEASTEMGNVSFGDVDLTAGQDAYISVSNDVSVWSGAMGDVSFGDLTVAAGLSATVYFENEISASTDLGNVSIGNVSLSATAAGAYLYASHDFSAWNGAIGNVSVGDVSVAAAANASAYYNFYMSGETAVGNVSIGDVSVSAVGASASASAYFDIENDSVGTIGNITVGDVAVTVNGDNAWGRFFVSASSASSAGTVTVGDLDLSVGNAAKKTNAYLDVSIGNDLGDVVVGDITLTGATVRAAGDVTMLYTADVSVWASDDASIGMIKVSGGDGVSDNFRSFGSAHDWNLDADTADHGETSWLNTTSVSGDVTIGGVDYSGYGVSAWIDVSGFLGAATIKGSAFGDTIIDNAGANSITGGAGADTFAFLDTNTGKTLATMDKIVDFSNTAGDKIDLSIGVNVGNYGEASYADFAAFVTGANAADKGVMVGLVGSTGYAAVDYNADNTVDFMIELTGLASLGNIDVASFA